MNNKDAAITCAKGCYQRNLIEGKETLGGSTLRGKAKNYMGRYTRSGLNLLNRLDKAGVKYQIILGPRGGWYSARLVVE